MSLSSSYWYAAAIPLASLITIISPFPNFLLVNEATAESISALSAIVVPSATTL